MPMDEHKQGFIDETGNLMNELEQHLLQLESDPENKQLFDAVYRSVHSLKGIAGMFGFEQIAKVSHRFENLLTQVREEKIKFDEALIELSLENIDFIKRSLQTDVTDETLTALCKDILHKIDTIMIQEETNENEASEITSFYVLLNPNADFEKRGVKLEAVFSLLEDNLAFKKYEKMTPAEKIQEKFYMFWEYVIVSTKKTDNIAEDILLEKDEIKSVKLAERDLLNMPDSEKFLEVFSNPLAETDLAPILKKYSKSKEENSQQKSAPKTHSELKEDMERTLVEYEVSGINVASSKLDNLMNYVSELISGKEAIMLFAQKQNIPDFLDLAENLDKTTNNIKDTALSMRLLPLESIMIKYKRLVRDLSHKYHKQIVFETDGTNTELDKTVINMLAEPLMHIIRNSIDHGIESPAERKKQGKNPTGRIKLFASNEGSEVVIQIHDDGRGIDPDLIRANALEKGLIHKDENLTKKDILNIVFMPGFSTAGKVSAISGRGVGMDVVKQKITDIRGDIDIDSEPGLGTYVTLRLPMTLSIIETLQVEINGYNYLIPQNVITNVDSVSQKEIDNNKKNLIELHGEHVPLIDLTKKFKNTKESYNNPVKKIVSVVYKDRNVGLITDRIVGDHQAVLKPLGELFKDKESFSGAGILGDGSLALMIDTNKLLKGMKNTFL